MSMTTLVALWAVLLAAVLALALVRKVLAARENDIIHLRDSEVGVIKQQVAVAQKLEVIDRYGKIITVAVVLYGLALAARFVYAGWLASTQLTN